MAAVIEEILVSGDSHVVEPPELFQERVPAALKARAPRAYFDEHFDSWVFGCDDMPPLPVSGLWSAGRKLEDTQTREMLRREGFKLAKPGGWDPVARLKDMDLDGVTAEVLYPSLGMQLYTIEDPALQEACFRAYNDWLIEYCARGEDRLIGLAEISLYNIDHAVAELERCRTAGLRGAMIWMSPPAGLAYSADRYERFWAAAQELEMPVNLHVHTGHGGTKDRHNHLGIERHRTTAITIVHDAEQTLFDLIFFGALERYPRLNVVLVEAQIGWLPYCMQLFDRGWNSVRQTAPGKLTIKPSEYFERQVFATFFNDYVGGQNLAWWGADNCLWSSDYPHANSTWPESHQAIEKTLGHLSAETRRKVLRTNVERLYNFKAPSR